MAVNVSAAEPDYTNPAEVIDLTNVLYDNSNIISDEEVEELLAIAASFTTPAALDPFPDVSDDELTTDQFGEPVVLAEWFVTDESDIIGTTVIATGGPQSDVATLQFMEDEVPQSLAFLTGGIDTGTHLDSPNDEEYWWEIKISSAEVAETSYIEVAWSMRTTTTGPRQFALEYRVGTYGEWQHVDMFDQLPPAAPPAESVWTDVESEDWRRSLNLPTSANGHDELYIRVLQDAEEGTRGTTLSTAGAPIGINATMQINNVVLSEIPVEPSDDVIVFDPMPMVEEVLASWNFTTNAQVNAARTPDNRAVIANGGILTTPAPILEFIVGGEAQPRTLNGGVNSINVLNYAGTGNGGLNGQANNAWWQTSLSTSGHEDIHVSFAMTSAGTGPRDFQVQYRVGSAGSWNSVGNIALSDNNTHGIDHADRQFGFHLPASADDEATIYIRWLLTSDYSARRGVGGFATDTIAAAGANRINYISIRSGVVPASVISIADANAATTGTIVTIEGYAVGVAQAAGGGNTNTTLFVQDGNGPNDGIQIFGTALNVHVGNRVRVTGTRGVNATVNQLTNPAFETLQTGVTITPTPVRVNELIPPAYRSTSISLERVQILELPAPGEQVGPPDALAPANAALVGVASGQRIELRPHANELPWPTGLAVGDWVSVDRAIVSWFNGRTAVQLLHATGISITTPPLVADVVADPSGGLITTESWSVTLSSETAAAEIRYRINGGAWQTGANPATVTVSFPTTTDNTATLETYARIGADETQPQTFTFDRLVLTPIRDVNAAAGGTFTVEGYAVTTFGSTGNDARNLWIMDGTDPNDGIVLWGGTAIPEDQFINLIGHRVRATGTRGNSPHGMTQLSTGVSAGVHPVSLGLAEPAVIPEISRVSDLVSPNYWAMRVSVERVQFHHRDSGLPEGVDGPLPPVGTHFIMCHDGNRIEMRLADGHNLPAGIETGDWIRINRAHVGQWTSGRVAVQLIDAEIELTDPPPVQDVVATPQSGTAIPAGYTVILSTYPEEGRIYFSLNGGPEQLSDDYSVEVTIYDFDQANDTAVIIARAVLPDPATPGDYLYELSPRTFIYTQAIVENVTSSHGMINGPSTPLRAGTIVELETATPDATITFNFSRNIGTPNEVTDFAVQYDGGILITEDMFPVMIWGGFASAPGFRDSPDFELRFDLRITGGEQIFFGQLHAHTTMSDGMGTPVAAFAEARDVAGLDFFVLSDHSNWFDWGGGSPASGPDTFNLRSYNSTGSNQWDTGNAAAAAAMTPDFLASNGFEFTWAGGPGHMNTFNTTGWVCRRNTYLNINNPDLRLQRYYELLRRTPESISMFNHPGTTFGNFQNFAHFDPEIAQRIPLIEVTNGEGAIGSSGFFPAYEQFTMALDRGWLVAPVNSQDNHRGRFGWSNEGRAAIYTNNFTYEGMWQAFRDRAVYATEIRDMEIRFYMNDEPMGSLVNNVPAVANFSAEIYVPEIPRVDIPGAPRDTYTIRRVSLVTNGGVELEVQNFNVPVGEVAYYEVAMNSPEPGYYFLRVIAVNSSGAERISVTAPIWIGRAPIVGISEVTTPTFMPVTDEALTIYTHLFNDEALPVTLVTLEYIINGSLYSVVAHNSVIAPGETPSISFNYTPRNQGIDSITVRAVINVNGVNRVYYGFLSINVRQVEALYMIGIDGAHFNDYVTGSNAGSFTNLASMAATMNFRTVIFNTEEEILQATQDPRFKLLIFAPPGRATGIITDPARGEHRSYSQAVVDAVAEFALGGGIVAISGYGNFNDVGGTIPGIEGAHSYQQNRLLAAMGSHIRVGDASHTPPVGFRGAFSHQHNLRFSQNVNLDNPFMQGVMTAEADPDRGLSGPTNTDEVPFDVQGGQIFRNFSTGALYAVTNPGAIIRSQADVDAYVARGTLPAEVNSMIWSHPGSWVVDSNGVGANASSHQGWGRTKFPTTGVAANPGNFPRYAHPTYGLAPFPGTGSGIGQRTAAGGTDPGQILMGASQDVGDGTVLVFSSVFFTNFDVRPDLDNPLDRPNINYTILRNILEPLAPEPIITPIGTVRQAQMGRWFTIEGIATTGLQVTGADSYQNRGFMNTIYIQDETGGISLFEVTENNAAGLEVGQLVRAHGFVGQYQGELQLVVHQGTGFVMIVDTEITLVDPLPLTTAEAASPDYTGWLAIVEGEVSDVVFQPGTEDTILQFVADDGSGPIIVYMRDYITPEVDLSFVLEEDAWVSVIALVSIGEVYGAEGMPRMRVRDREEIQAAERPEIPETCPCADGDYCDPDNCCGAEDCECPQPTPETCLCVDGDYCDPDNCCGAEDCECPQPTLPPGGQVPPPGGQVPPPGGQVPPPGGQVPPPGGQVPPPGGQVPPPGGQLVPSDRPNIGGAASSGGRQIRNATRRPATTRTARPVQQVPNVDIFVPVNESGIIIANAIAIALENNQLPIAIFDLDYNEGMFEGATISYADVQALIDANGTLSLTTAEFNVLFSTGEMAEWGLEPNDEITIVVRRIISTDFVVSIEILLEEVLEVYIMVNGVRTNLPFSAVLSVDISEIFMVPNLLLAGVSFTEILDSEAAEDALIALTYDVLDGSRVDNSFIFFVDEAGLFGIRVEVVDVIAEEQATLNQRELRLQAGDGSFFIDPVYSRAMVPLRFVAETFGADVEWIESSRIVRIENNGVMLLIPVDEPLPNGMGRPAIVNGRTFVPVSYVSEALGATVSWDESGSITIIL